MINESSLPSISFHEEIINYLSSGVIFYFPYRKWKFLSISFEEHFLKLLCKNKAEGLIQK